jgi:hypothetical protein
MQEPLRNNVKDTLVRYDGFVIGGARSRGSGVFAAFDWRHLTLNPGPEIEAKAYKPSRIDSFDRTDHEDLSRLLGHYSDVQSINSEDTVTWSCFRGQSVDRWIDAFVDEAFGSGGRSPWSRPILWDRRQHPDGTGTVNGPEADVILESPGTDGQAWRYVVEAKWLADLDGRQGADRTRTQVDMRLHTARYGDIARNHSGVIVVCPSPKRYFRRGGRKDVFSRYFEPDGESYISKIATDAQVITWERIAALAGGELEEYLSWRLNLLDRPRAT